MPPKAAAAKKPKEDVAERMIIDYLNQQNRPFSAQLLQTSLSSQGLTKTQITKALDKLALEGAITEGTFGKTKIYWRVQEDEPDADGDSSASSLESEVQALSAELKELQRETSTIEARVGGLSKELTVAEMDARIAFLEVDNVEKEAKLERLRTSSAGLTQAEVTKLRRKYDGAKAEWRKRKRKCREIMDQITEGSGMTRKQLQEEAGIDSDTDVGADVDEDRVTKRKRALDAPASIDPKKRKR